MTRSEPPAALARRVIDAVPGLAARTRTPAHG
jgi:hypothetical protein